MGMREWWSARGPNWRFPAKEEAGANLRYAFGSLRRPWVVIVLILVWTSFLVFTWGDTDNSIALVFAVLFTSGLMRAVGPPNARRP